MSTIALTTAASTITLVGGRATVTASVTNSGGTPQRVTLGVFPAAASASGPAPLQPGSSGPSGAPPPAPAPAEWVVVDRPTRDLAPGQTEQFTVSCAAPATLAPGAHRIRLIAYSATQAPEENAAQARELEILAPAPAPAAPAKPGMPWWVWAVAAALVVIVVGAGFWVIRGRSDTPPQAQPTPTTASPTLPPPPSPSLPSGYCLTGYVERRARLTDVVCVLPASAQQAEFDNRREVQKARKNDPPGGPYGPETCRVGWVWRDAFAGDTICVTGDVRARTAQENGEAHLHTSWSLPTFIIGTWRGPVPTWVKS